MAVNNFKPFGIANGANVTTQTDYESLPALGSGFNSGKASSAQINKAIRQGTVMASILAQFIANLSGQDVLDDGNTQVVLNNFISALNTNGANNLLQKNNNLSEIKASGALAQSSAQSNLGLGTAATRNVGSGANQIPDMSFFASNKSAVGWQQLPGGLIIQWGLTQSIAANSSASVAFPISFPGGSLSVVATFADSITPGRSVTTNISAMTNTAFAIRNPDAGTSQFRWIAIGY